jgi:PAS domain S-box-containing protein
VSGNDTDPGQRIGVVGDAFGLTSAEDPSEPIDRYDFVPVSLDSLATNSLDGVVIDAATLAEGVDSTLAESCAERPAISIGESEQLTVSNDLLQVLDAHVVYDGGFDALGSTLRDRFEERRIDLGMAPAEFLNTLFEEMPIHMYMKDREGRHVRVSDHSFDPDRLVGQRDIDLFEDSQLAAQTYQADLEIMETGEPVLKVEEYNEERGVWALTSKVPIRDDGAVVGLAGVTWLITKRKEYQQRLEQQNERLEQFAEVLSHDLRNPLTVAMGLVEHRLDANPDDEQLQTIDRQLKRMNSIVEDVLTLTRRGDQLGDVSGVSLATAREIAGRPSRPAVRR